MKQLLVLLVGLVFSAYAMAQQAIGTVISVQGSVAAINQAKQQRELQRRSEIYLYDRIVTQQNAKVQLRLKDDSMIIVQASSEFYVSEFSFDKDAPRNTKYVGNIVKGMLINISGQGDSKNYQLNSPVATIAFRGTYIIAQLVAGELKVHVISGGAVITSRSGMSLIIAAGQSINAATVSSIGAITGYKSSGLSGEISTLDKTLIMEGGGAVTIRCKVAR